MAFRTHEKKNGITFTKYINKKEIGLIHSVYIQRGVKKQKTIFIKYIMNKEIRIKKNIDSKGEKNIYVYNRFIYKVRKKTKAAQQLNLE